MIEEPVAFKILLVLYEHAQNHKTGLHVNAIFKELVARHRIGKNKERVIDALNDLVQGDLIETNMVGKQKEVKTLKPIGQEFVKMYIDISRYVTSGLELMLLVFSIFDIVKSGDKKVQRGILHEKGWTVEEINQSEKILATCAKLTSLVSPYEVVSVVLMRYILVLSKISDNMYAKTLLNQIVMDTILLILSRTSAKMDDKKMTFAEAGYLNLMSQKLKFLQYVFDQDYYNTRFIKKEVNNFIKSLEDVLLLDYQGKRANAKLKLEAKTDEEFQREAVNK